MPNAGPGDHAVALKGDEDALQERGDGGHVVIIQREEDDLPEVLAPGPSNIPKGPSQTIHRTYRVSQ